MFDIGFLELALVGIVALLIVGPERFPEMIKSVMAVVNKARNVISDVRSDFDHEIHRADEIKRLMEREAQLLKEHSILDENKKSVPIGVFTSSSKLTSEIDHGGKTRDNEDTSESLKDRATTGRITPKV